ncbi:hypothetical protein [Fibrobacter sp.]|uniref:phage head-tail connector protein n=1 Tax=Fibrobacter sp. TaxID=35828 RepID=UPI00388E7051
MDSILDSIKKLLGPTETYDNFDTDLIFHINSALANLTQIGVGPAEGLSIEDDSSTWEEFVTDPIQLGHVRTYVYLKVKLVFDPPTNSAVLQSYENQVLKLEWLLDAAVNYKN